ncbi:MAG: DMT family transporter [Marinosulfonomonas sp.]|nr:DMT family transporter [Marinosulfonomonas sp.]
MSRNNNRAGILLMIATTMIFAMQDAFSRHLAGNYNVFVVVMIRYWFFGAFAIAIALRHPRGFDHVARTHHPRLQILRGALLALEICVMVFAFVLLGLVETHAVFTSYPLLIAALSGPILGEMVGWRRWTAICIGFVGILIILRPGYTVFSPAALIPFCGAVMFAVYGLVTRFVSAKDSALTSFFWTGIIGAIVMTAIGIWYWEPMNGPDSILMAVLCVTGVLGHWMLIKCYELAEASAVQPFAFLQLVFVSIIGISVFNEVLQLNVVIGASLVVAASVFTLLRTGKATLRQD